MNSKRMEKSKQYTYLENNGRDNAEVRNRFAQGKNMVKIINNIWMGDEITKIRKH